MLTMDERAVLPAEPAYEIDRPTMVECSICPQCSGEPEGVCTDHAALVIELL